MRKVHCENYYQGYRLSQTTHNDNGFHIVILEKIASILQYMVSKHNKVFFTMFVLKYPAGFVYMDPSSNSLLSRFLESLILAYKRKGCDPKYLWVREQSNTGQFHYHLMLLFDGNKIQNAYGVLDYATRLWANCLMVENGKGLVHLCEPGGDKFRYGGIMIRRFEWEYETDYKKCFEAASYLAKRYSKGQSPAYVNEYGMSRLSKPPRQDDEWTHW